MSQSPTGSLRFDYDADVDLLFASVGEPREAIGVEVRPGVCVRVAGNVPVSIEVVDCAATFNRRPEEINRAFARGLLSDYGPQAVARLRSARALV